MRIPHYPETARSALIKVAGGAGPGGNGVKVPDISGARFAQQLRWLG